jgi:hypothetical protein
MIVWNMNVLYLAMQVGSLFCEQGVRNWEGKIERRIFSGKEHFMNYNCFSFFLIQGKEIVSAFSIVEQLFQYSESN